MSEDNDIMVLLDSIEFLPIGDEPPPETITTGSGRYPWALVLHEFRKRPNQWGRLPNVGTTPSLDGGVVTKIRRGQIAAAGAGEFEAVRRGPEVWVRYVVPDLDPIDPVVLDILADMPSEDDLDEAMLAIDSRLDPAESRPYTSAEQEMIDGGEWRP